MKQGRVAYNMVSANKRNKSSSIEKKAGTWA